MAPEQQPTFEELLSRRGAMEEQREVLGAVVDPVIADINTRLEALVPQLSEDQQALISSWQTVVETCQALELDAPEPSKDIAAALEAQEQRLAFTGQISGEMSVAETVAKPEPVPEPTKPAGSPKPKTTPKATAPAAEAKIDTNTRVVIDCGDGKELVPKDSTKSLYVSLFKAFLGAKDQTVNIAEFLRKETGLSSTEAGLVFNGTRQLAEFSDQPLVIGEVRAQHAQFYGILKTLRDKSIVEHISGTHTAEPGSSSSQSGTVRPFGLTGIAEADGEVRIHTQRKPYHVTVNEYEQSIDNGRDKVVRLDREATNSFMRVSQALGAIALREPSEQSKFTRSDLAKWVSEANPDAPLAAHEPAMLAESLHQLIDHFNEDFPLHDPGKFGGAHFTWDHGVSVDRQAGWPEKPNFDNAATISFSENQIIVTIDGQAHVVTDYSRMAKALEAKSTSADVNTFIERGKKMFGALALLGEKDELEVADMMDLLYGKDLDQQKQALNHWFRGIIANLNEAAGETIVNWRARQGVVIDVNRKIVIDEDPGQGAAEPTPPQQGEAKEPANEKGKVSRRRTPQEVVAGIDELDEKTKTNIRQSLIVNGRILYPKSLPETGYLLSLVLDEAVLADIRNGERFGNHQDPEDYRNFLSRIVYTCYVRTLSWGHFTELASELRSQTERPSNVVSSRIQTIEKSRKEIVREISAIPADPSERTHDQEYMATLSDHLLQGHIPQPKTSIQAVGLLDLFRSLRTDIARQMTQTEFNQLVAKMHDYAEDLLGNQNAFQALRSRDQFGSQGDRRRQKGTLTAGSEATLSRTKDALPPRPRHASKKSTRKQ